MVMVEAIHLVERLFHFAQASLQPNLGIKELQQLFLDRGQITHGVLHGGIVGISGRQHCISWYSSFVLSFDSGDRKSVV